MLDFVLRPIRSALGAASREVHEPLEETEHEILDTVRAIDEATKSIDRHVQVLEGLATSMGPLTDSVDRLTATMTDLVAMLEPLATVERDVGRTEHTLRFWHHKDPDETASEEADGDDAKQ
jgi:hypothetical protein